MAIAAKPKITYAARTSKSRRKQIADARSRDERFAAALSRIMADKDSRELVMYLLQDLCGTFSPSANAAFDEQGLHFREGARAVGLTVHKELLRLVKDLYMVGLQEHIR